MRGLRIRAFTRVIVQMFWIGLGYITAEVIQIKYQLNDWWLAGIAFLLVSMPGIPRFMRKLAVGMVFATDWVQDTVANAVLDVSNQF